MRKGLTAARSGDSVEKFAELDASVARLTEARDWVALLRVICRHGARVLGQGGVRQLRTWLAAFSSQAIAESPWITYWSGAAVQSDSPVAASTDRTLCHARCLLDRLACGNPLPETATAYGVPHSG